MAPPAVPSTQTIDIIAARLAKQTMRATLLCVGDGTASSTEYPNHRRPTNDCATSIEALFNDFELRGGRWGGKSPAVHHGGAAEHHVGGTTEHCFYLFKRCNESVQ